MKTTNVANGAQRICDVGLVWTELRAITVAGVTTHNVSPYTTLRISVKGDTVVSIDGVVAVTILANTSLNINAGPGAPGNGARNVIITVDSGAAVAAVSLAYDNDYGRINP